MKGKIIVSAVSLILVVGVVIGAVVINHNNNITSTDVKANVKAADKICQSAEQKDLCVQTLGTVKDNSDPKEYVAAVLKASTESVIKAFNMSDRLIVEHGNKGQGVKMALDDCKDLLESALDSLQLSTDMVGGSDVRQVHDQTADFRNWLTAVISYQQACLDGFDDGNEGEKAVKELFKSDSLDHIGKITGVALDLVADLSNILQQFGLQLDLKPSSRRLLGAEEIDEEGLPTWLSASDRKLLAKVGKKKGGKGKGKGKGRGKAAAGAAAGAAVGAGAASAAGPGARTVVVAKDGSGQFRTVKEAIDAYPKDLQGRYVINVKAGVYDEYITVPKTSANILMVGDGPLKTIITGRKNFALAGIKTMMTATFANTAPGFIAKGIRFENTAGIEGHQAVALRNQGDMSAFFDCHIVGYQDSLYVQTNRQFYRNCEISGTIDFIFGTSATLIQNSRIIVRKPKASQFNTITADGTEHRTMNSGIVLQGCDIVAEAGLVPAQNPSYFGRPWKAYSTAVIMESNIDGCIHPEGWKEWEGAPGGFTGTLYFVEYANTGPGSNVAGRVKWNTLHTRVSAQEAAKYTAAQFLAAGPTSRAEDWLKTTGVPFTLGFSK
ncbi:unnamed protein product [Lupinus luteus]|uniref:Pectinesterase n=1 Tax=Lupinus luteus TaxID=3873 RepID=A0AAV1X5N9_LUPLU